MSRRRNNNVRGPTSALTEFLKEQKITPSTVARRVQTRGRASGLAQVHTADQEEDPQEEQQPQQPEEPPQPEAGPSRRRGRRASGYNSDELDDPEDEDEPPTKKRKTTTKSKAAQAKEKENAKKKAKAKAKKGKADDSDDDNEDEDAYTALSKMWAPNATKPPIGSFEECAKCTKQFTVTKYTMAATPPPGFLCHACAKASGADPFKKPAAPRRRKTEDRRKIVHFEEKPFPTLVSMCISIISNHIDDVEALGGLDGVNLEAIAKSLAKNRNLTAQNAPLFYDVRHTNLTLYDATNLAPPALCALGSLNPNLTSLRLDFCGRMDDTVLAAWSTSLPALTRIDLLGPFLVKPAAWQAFFATHPNMTGFLITQSPRFDLACVKALVRHCPGLRELRLREIGLLADAWLDEISALAGVLESLDLAEPAQSLSEDALVALLAAVGPGLMHLDLSGHTALTDAFLEDGLAEYAEQLATLHLADCPALTDEGVAALFDAWEEAVHPPLVEVGFARDHLCATEALQALVNHSGSALVKLDVNGWREAGQEALEDIGRCCLRLRRVDLGFCREVGDFVVNEILEGCPGVEEIKVWGCNRVTESCPKKRGVSILGFEAHIA